MARRKLFCEYGPVCYWISLRKERLLRRVRDLAGRQRFASTRQTEPLPALVKGHCSVIRRRLAGVDPRLQEGKARNLELAAAQVNGLIIAPGETFSFWRPVGNATRRRGYQEGLTISGGQLGRGIGGGLCQLANLIHWLVLNSPLTVTELHHHSDALFQDERRTVPFGTGTSVFYNNVDYRFRNDSDQPVQLLVWLREDELCGELRCLRPFPCRYRLVEENSHYARLDDGYYRLSQVYKLTIDRASGRTLRRELILDNHSRVLFDPALIPPEELRREDGGQWCPDPQKENAV